MAFPFKALISFKSCPPLKPLPDPSIIITFVFSSLLKFSKLSINDFSVFKDKALYVLGSLSLIREIPLFDNWILILDNLNNEGIGQVGPEGSMWFRKKPVEKVSNDKIREVDTVAGYLFIVKRTVYDLIGGMDTAYTPAFVEDIDISFAIRNIGYKCLAIPGLDIKHHHISGASSSDKPIKYMLNKKAYRKDLDIRNLDYFEKKWEKFWKWFNWENWCCVEYVIINLIIKY